MFALPEEFAQRMIDLQGVENGTAWLQRLPAIPARYEERWELTVGLVVEMLSYNYVVPAVRHDGTPVIVKVCPPDGEYQLETEALRLFNGRGISQLLACDPDDQAMLLERLEPGTLLRSVEDDGEATSIAASVMRQLWCPVPANHPFPTVANWGRGFTRLRQRYNGGNGPFPAALLDEAETLFRELTDSMTETVLLHGDLHHDNILAAQRQPWLTIDPKGLVRQPTYEVGSLLRNPLPDLLNHPQPGRILAHRIDQLSEELGFDRTRVRNWALAQTVLSVWWLVEDFGEMAENDLACAELLAEIKR